MGKKHEPSIAIHCMEYAFWPVYNTKGPAIIV